MPARRHVPWPQMAIALAALCMVLPLIVKGCSCGHDWDFHLQNWMEVASQWRHGIVKPVWAFTGAWGAGEPRILLYPPLSMMLGGVLTLVLPFVAVPIAYSWVALVLSGLSMHWLLRRWVSQPVATLVACLYLANPYSLFVVYERTAYAELLAAAWIPLLIGMMLRPRFSAWLLAIPVMLLWMTNAPAAVMGSYTVLVLGVVRLVAMRREGVAAMLRFAGAVTLGFVTGVLMDAFYLLPVMRERALVQIDMVLIAGMRPIDNFLFEKIGDGPHDAVLVTVSWIAVAMVVTALSCGWAMLLRPEQTARLAGMRAEQEVARESTAKRLAIAPLLAMSAFILLLLLPWSAPVWRLAPQLRFLQFPWRWLAVEGVVAGGLMAMMFDRMLSHAKAQVRLRWVLIGGVMFVLLGGLYGDHEFRLRCDATDEIAELHSAFERGEGVDATDEYTPAAVENDALGKHLPGAWITRHALLPSVKDADVAQANGTLVAVTGPHPDDLFYSARSDVGGAALVVRVRDFAGWHVMRDGVELHDLPHREDGLIAVALPPGAMHTVELRYRKTPDQWAGAGVSALAMLVFVGVGWRRSGIIKPA